MDEAMAVPAGSQEPGSRGSNLADVVRVGRCGGDAPTVEPAAGARRVGLCAQVAACRSPLHGVMPVIEQHIAQGSMHLERCPQRAQVVTTVEHFALALEEPVRKLADSSADLFIPQAIE